MKENKSHLKQSEKKHIGLIRILTKLHWNIDGTQRWMSKTFMYVDDDGTITKRDRDK